MIRDLSVIVPLRGRMASKTRLASDFSEAAREQLVLRMGETVLDAVLESGVASQVVLVTRDPVFAQQVIGPRTGIRIVHQTARFEGLTGAIALGRDAAIATSTMVIFADLPAVQADDVRVMVEDRSRVVAAPDRHRQGTNAVLVRDDSDGEFRYRFGMGSFAAHLAEAASLHWPVGVVERPGLSVDLDTIDDWQGLPVRLRDELLPTRETDPVSFPFAR